MHVRSRFSLRFFTIRDLKKKDFWIQFLRHLLLFKVENSELPLPLCHLQEQQALFDEQVVPLMVIRRRLYGIEEDADLAGCIRGFQKKEGFNLVIMIGNWQN